MMFSRGIRAPGDWRLRLAEEFRGTEQVVPEFFEVDRNPSVGFDDSPVEPDNAFVEERGQSVVPSPEASSTNIPSKFPGGACLSVGDWVYYKAHLQSSAEKRFHAGFTPKWLRSVKLDKPLGTGVFLTEVKHPTKLHVSAMK